MKQKSSINKSTATLELTSLEKKLDKKFERIERLFALSDEKNVGMEKRLRSEINSSTYSTTQRLERNFEAQIQLGTRDLKRELKETEERLNNRITKVGDLITIALGKKIKSIEKRLVYLEHPHQAP